MSDKTNIHDMTDAQAADFVNLVGGCSVVPGWRRASFIVNDELLTMRSGNIPQSAYNANANVTAAALGSSCTSIGHYAFLNCVNLQAVSFPSSLTSLGVSAFDGCLDLASDIVLPYGVTSLGGNVFRNCASLTSVVLPESAVTIGASTFWGCTSLASANIPVAVTAIPSSMFRGCTSLEAVAIPAGTTSIGQDAFYGCAALDTALPAGLVSIGQGAFYGCVSLTTADFGSSLTSIDSSAFQGCTSLESVVLPDSLASIGQRVFQGCTSLASATLPSVMGSIPSYMFFECALTAIQLPDGLTSIGYAAFYNCYSLASVNIPSTVTSIGNGAFLRTALSEVTLPAGLTVLGDSSFRWTGITSIDIPGSVSSIGGYAFHSCTSLTTVTLNEGLVNIGSYAFYQCPFTSITFPDSLRTIGAYAFRNNRLTEIVLPDGFTTVGQGAFNNSGTLTSVTLPGTVTDTGYSSFAYCGALTDVLLTEGIASIAASTFYSCPSLTSMPFPETLTSVGDNAFVSCGLTNATFEYGLTTLGASVFGGCLSLNTVHFAGDAPTAGATLFNGCPAGLIVYRMADTGGWPAFGDLWNERPTAAWTSFPDPMPVIALPTLDFNPAATKTFSSAAGVVRVDSTTGPDPVFSRASGATFTDVDGLLKWAPENWLQHSENAAGLTSYYVALTGGQADPDGGTAAIRMFGSTDNQIHYVKWVFGPTGTHYVKVRVKPDGCTRCFLRYRVDTGDLYGIYDLTGNGSVWYDPVIPSTITKVGDWYEIAAEVPGPTNINREFAIGLANPAGTGLGDSITFVGSASQGIHFWHPQLSRSQCAYIATGAATAYGPRFEHDPVTHACNGLMLEGAVTNLCVASTNLANAQFPLAGVTVATTLNVIDGPMGETDCDFVKENNTNARHELACRILPAALSGNPMCCSTYIRKYTGAPQRRYVAVCAMGAFGYNSRYMLGVDTQLGTYTVHTQNPPANGVGGIVDCGDFWRVWVAGTFAATADGGIYLLVHLWDTATPTLNSFLECVYTGDSTSGAYVTAVQIEPGLRPTSYIPTYTTTLARSADVCEVTGSDFSGFYNATTGTFVVAGECTRANDSYLFAVRNSDWTSRLVPYTSSNNLYGYSLEGPTGSNKLVGATSSDALAVAVAYSSGDGSYALDGAVAVADADFVNVASADRLAIGTYYFSGTISRLRFWPSRLPDVSLQSLTTQ